MVNVPEKRNKAVAIFSLILSILYFFFGSLEITFWLGFDVTYLSPVTIYSDAFAGFTLIVTSLIFAAGFINLWRNEVRGYSYVLVGLFVASVLGILQFLILVANWTERYVLLNEDFADWTWIDDFRAVIPLWIMSLPLIVPLRSLKMRRV
ncbi:MAG: hypothetical protein ACTSSP_01545 [Candidatus Asgardarchaeia archaeon]